MLDTIQNSKQIKEQLQELFEQNGVTDETSMSSEYDYIEEE